MTTEETESKRNQYTFVWRERYKRQIINANILILLHVIFILAGRCFLHTSSLYFTERCGIHCHTFCVGYISNNVFTNKSINF